jgi:hypothetical protein
MNTGLMCLVTTALLLSADVLLAEDAIDFALPHVIHDKVITNILAKQTTKGFVIQIRYHEDGNEWFAAEDVSVSVDDGNNVFSVPITETGALTATGSFGFGNASLTVEYAGKVETLLVRVRSLVVALTPHKRETK